MDDEGVNQLVGSWNLSLKLLLKLAPIGTIKNSTDNGTFGTSFVKPEIKFLKPAYLTDEFYFSPSLKFLFRNIKVARCPLCPFSKLAPLGTIKNAEVFWVPQGVAGCRSLPDLKVKSRKRTHLLTPLFPSFPQVPF